MKLSVMVLGRTQWAALKADQAGVVREAASLAALHATVQLDHRVFGEPLLEGTGLHREWAGYGRERRLFYVPGEDGSAWAAAGFTSLGRFILLGGGETHPAHRERAATARSSPRG